MKLIESELFWVLCFVRKKIIMKRSRFEKRVNFTAENIPFFALLLFSLPKKAS